MVRFFSGDIISVLSKSDKRSSTLPALINVVKSSGDSSSSLRTNFRCKLRSLQKQSQNRKILNMHKNKTKNYTNIMSFDM